MGSAEKIEEIKEKVERHSLTMSRVPKKTKLRFMELAVDFEDDYGMLLKALVEKYDSQNYLQEMICAQILELKEKVESLENKEPAKQIKTLGGKIIKGGERIDEQT